MAQKTGRPRNRRIQLEAGAAALNMLKVALPALQLFDLTRITLPKIAKCAPKLRKLG